METLLNSTCSVVTACCRQLGTDWRGTNYRDGVSRLYYIERGEAWVRHHDRQFRLRPGRMYLIPARTVFSFGCAAPFVQHWVHFNLTLHGGLELFDCVDCRHEIVVQDPRRVLRAMKVLQQSIARKDLAARLEAGGVLLQLLAPFADRAGLGPPRDPLLQKLGAVLQFIDANLSEPLPVGLLARQAQLERTYFSKIFAQHTGLAPARFIQRRRMEVARDLLLTDTLPVAAVGEQVGLADPFHFSKVFKRHAGLPPSEFRRRGPTP